MSSRTLRDLLDELGCHIGNESYGPWATDLRWCPGALSVGSYVSIASSVRTFRRDHPIDGLLTHPISSRPELGLAVAAVPHVPLTIGDDVWIAHGATILCGCSEIGRGAVIAAGAVVTRDVGDFEIVAGIPGRVIAKRRAAHPDYRRVHEAITAAQRVDVGQVLADYGFELGELSDLSARD